MPSVFLSHNSKDKQWVRNLAKRLTADGVVVWLDEAELKVGDSLIERISTAIDTVNYVAVVISRHSVQSVWVRKELSLAMTKEVAGKKVAVLPMLIEQCELPDILRDKLYADFRNAANYEAEYEKVLRTIGVRHDPNTRPASHSRDAVPSIPSQDQPVNMRIVGVVKSKTRQDAEHAGLQDYFFQLSGQPSSIWADQFVAARRFPRHSMWRKAWVEGDCIVVKCTIDELGRYHLKDLKRDVATANANSMRLITENDQIRLNEQERKRVELTERDSALDALDFE